MKRYVFNVKKYNMITTITILNKNFCRKKKIVK